jgi:hypothetical protein
MKRIALLAVLGFCLAAPSIMMAQGTHNHAEVGAFVDYLRFDATNPAANLVGVGGRVGFNVHPNVRLEAEMSYDFERSFVNVNSSGTGGNGTVVRTKFRPLPVCSVLNFRLAVRDRFAPSSPARLAL